MLLHTVTGPRSFEDIKTVNSVIYQTYQAACKALDLIEDDSHWDDTLKEASVTDSPSKLRQLFAIIIVFCHTSEPIELWTKYKKYSYDDYGRNLIKSFSDIDLDLYIEQLENRCLIDLENTIISIGGNPINQYELPIPNINANFQINREYLSETSYNQSILTAFVIENEAKINTEQKIIYDEVINSVNMSKGGMFFIDAPGGTGITFLINLILSKVRSSGKIALAVASSGISATLLPGGKTAHSMFKIPIDIDRHETPVCNISKNSDKAKVIRDACLIVWDECTMANKKAIEAVDKTLQDLQNDQNRMGGITF